MRPRIRRLSIRQLHRRNPQTPYISFEIITRFLDDFGRHPEGCADEGEALGFDVCELGGDAEVCDFYLSGGGEEGVGGFDVAVDFAGLVEVVEAFEEFAAYDCDVGFAEGAGFELVVMLV